MIIPRDCLRCHGRLEAGFVVDHGHYGSPDTQNWFSGTVERSFWTGLRTKGREKHEVTTWRCTKCGMLESYAGPQNPSVAVTGK